MDFTPSVSRRLYSGLKRSVRWFQLSAEIKSKLKDNIQLPKLRRSKRCFVIGTGPSLKLEDLKRLAGEDIILISNAFLHPDLPSMSPRMQFFASYHKPLIEENYLDWLKNADLTLPLETAIIVPTTEYERIKKRDLFQAGRKVFYVHLADLPQPAFRLDRTMMAPQTGPQMSLSVLAAMGYDEIYLLGCDHTVLRDYKANINHFYENSLDVRKNASDLGAWNGIIDSHIGSIRVFIQYEKYLKAFAERGGPQLINLSRDTWFDFTILKTLDEVLPAKGTPV